MNHLLNLTKKELKELLTPGAIVSVLVMVFIFMGVGTMISSETESLSTPSKIGIINDDEGGYWSEFAIDSMPDFYIYQYETTHEEALEYIIMLDSPYGDFEQINKEMAEKGLVTVFMIPSDFTEKINSKERTKIDQYYVFRNEGVFGTTSSLVSSMLIPWISSSISYELVSDITDPSTPAEFLLSPVLASSPQTYINGQIHEGVTPTDIATTIMSQTMMVPIVIMMIIMVIGGMVISSMGSEKENKTLETLLTMPMKRTTIVSGKLLAAAIVGLVYGMAYMVGMSFYVGGVTSPMGGVNLQDYGLSLGITEWAIMAVMIFLAIFCALGICMILGAFTKNYKASQTMILPIMVL
ncbi:MAG: ABC transporter permease, partial [Methanomassiliicoccaceae archaeon]|nr:ABC transporter permease [Methanomassiliicoccaceae archaeon]